MLKHRIITGGLALSLVAAVYRFFPVWMLGAVVMALTVLAVIEMVDLLTKAGYPALKWSSMAVVMLWMSGAGLTESGIAHWEGLRFVMPVLAVWIISLGCLFRTDQSQSLAKLTGSFLTIAYTGGLLQFLLMLLLSGREGMDGRSLLLYGILVVKSTDMGAYFAGSAIGRHRMIPAISPAKTWEGVIGGVLVAVAVSSLVLRLYSYQVSGYAFSPLDGLVLGLGLAVLGILGDLVESMLKRSAKMKDSGTWLKGMGGILDVLDSLMFAIPLLYIYIRWGLNGL